MHERKLSLSGIVYPSNFQNLLEKRRSEFDQMSME